MAPPKKTIDTVALQELIQQGATAIQAARALSTSRRVVLRTARAMGTPFIKCKKAVFSQQESDRLRELYGQGMNDYEVAKILHVSRGRLRVWREENLIGSQTRKKDLTSDICPDIHSRLMAGDTLTHIGSLYGVSRSSIAKLLKKNHVEYSEYRPASPAWAPSYHLSDYQTQFLIGDLFGDGGLCSTSESSAYFHAGQSVAQEMLVRWRFETYAPLISNVHVNLEHNSIGAKTWTCRELGYWHQVFYGTGEKVLTPAMVEHMTPIGLAAWYMGDGSLARNTPYFHVGLQVDLIPIAGALSNRFGFSFDARRHEYEWHLWIRDKGSFFSLVAPYIIPYFAYKVQDDYRHLVASKLDPKSISVITGESFRELPSDERESIIDSFSGYFMRRGLTCPYMNLRDIKSTLRNLRTGFSGKRTPKELCECFAPYRFDDCRQGSSPLRIWQDKKAMRIFVEGILGTLTGTFSDGSIWRGLESRGVPVVGDPLWSAGICRSILPRGGRVLDVSVEYGERMVGCSSCPSISYVGVDPRKKSAPLLAELSDRCREINGSDIVLIQECFEDCELCGVFDIIFVDLPFYGEYSYGFEVDQCQIRYPIFSEWLNSFWIPSIIKCLNHVTVGGNIFIKVVGARKSVAIDNAVKILSDKMDHDSYGEWVKFNWRSA